jgi:hypothetical protein
MKCVIDNFDGLGPRDYSSAVAAEGGVRIQRRLNEPTQLDMVLSGARDFVVPSEGARVRLTTSSGVHLFTGYVVGAPAFEYLGWGEDGPVYQYRVRAMSDEILLDRKKTPSRVPFVNRSAGAALRQATEDLLPGAFDSSGVAELDAIPYYATSTQKSWSKHAGEIALLARAAYRAEDGALVLRPIGETRHRLSESDNTFAADGLKARPTAVAANDVTVLGRIEPQCYVKDYMIGDGLSLRFDLSHNPFTRFTNTLLEEEYGGTGVDKTRWEVADPAAAVSVAGGKLQVGGGTGQDGGTVVTFVEQLELGGALVLQHGEAEFTAASNGVVGGLYAGGVAVAGCMAGFRVTPSGGQSAIRAVINGAATGTTVATVAGHRYAMSTRLLASEVYRKRQVFHSSARTLGGEAISADVRVVLEVHEIDPGDPATLALPAVVLYDGVLAGAPQYCTYATVNATSMHLNLAFTRALRAADAEIRSALPGQAYRTRLAGSLSEGSECQVASGPALYFFTQYVPAAGEKIVARYRSSGQSAAHVQDSANAAEQRRDLDDGWRGGAREVAMPSPRSSAECELAARAILDDGVRGGWTGEYESWSDFLPSGATDVRPGDVLELDVPSRELQCSAVVRAVTIEGGGEDHNRYSFVFADESAEPLSIDQGSGKASEPRNLPTLDTTMTAAYPGELYGAEVTAVSSTTVSIDAGTGPPAGGVIEARRSDSGWTAGNDRNLAGRFSTRTFVLPRITRVQDYYLRPCDAHGRYSRYSVLLHVDYPL